MNATTICIYRVFMGAKTALKKSRTESKPKQYDYNKVIAAQT